MRTKALRLSLPRRLGFVGLLLTGLLALSAFGTGCSETEDASTGSLVTPLSETSGDESWGPPTIDELSHRLDLSAEQAEQITVLLASWQSQHEERRGRFGHGGPGRPSDGERPEFEPPHHRFLAECSEILNQEQFLELIEFLKERREAAMEQRRESGRHGEGRPPGRHGPRGGFGRGSGGERGPDLGLNEEQKTQFMEAMREHRDARQELIRAFHEEEITADALRSGLKDLREEMETKLGSFLTEEQLAAFREHREERRTERLQRQLERPASGLERRVGFLTKVLRLEDAQVTQLEEILSSAHAEMQALLEQALEGSIDPEDAFVDGLLLRQQTTDAIRAILNDEQLERFDALGNLLHGHGRRFRHHL